MEPTFQAPWCLMLSNIKQSKRQFVSPLRNIRVDQPIPSCGRLLVEHQSRCSPLRVTLALPTLFPTGAADLLGQYCNQVIFTTTNTVLSLYTSLCAISYSSLPLPLQSYPYTLHCASSVLALARPTMPCIH